jgi:hypothetical protein
MKKKKSLIISFYVLLCVINILPFSIGHWGRGDCTKWHPLQFIDIPYDPDAEVNLDGLPIESFWRSEKNKRGNLIIPLASNINESDFFIVYLNATFILSDDYIFILFEWNDNTTIPIGGDISDGLYICWNINVLNFSAYFIYGMDTSHMGGGNVDCWSLNINQDSPPNGSSYFCQDLCFGDNGWYNPNLEFEDVLIAYTYVENQSYSLEMIRKIKTDDNEYDVQFDQKIVYKFNIAIMDNGDHEDHALSWTYAFDFRPKIIYGYLPELTMVIGIVSIAVIIKKIYVNKLKIRNVA